MLETHDLLPVSWKLELPAVVCTRLVDMGGACNRAVLAVEQAYLQQRYACAEADSAAMCPETARYHATFARNWFDIAVSYIDQLTAAYTVAATIFVAYATMVASVYAAWGTIPLTEPSRMLPSRLLGDPAIHLPLVQMPAVARQAILDHNHELAASHQTLMHVVDVTVRSHPLDIYDFPSRVASRPPMSVDLGVDLASRMHAYAANCAWALGLATRGDHDPPESA